MGEATLTADWHEKGYYIQQSRVLVVYNDKATAHREGCLFSGACYPIPGSDDRIPNILSKLSSYNFAFADAKSYPDELLQLAHTKEYINRIQELSINPPANLINGLFWVDDITWDTRPLKSSDIEPGHEDLIGKSVLMFNCTAMYPGVYAIAKKAVDVTLTAADLVLKNDVVYALVRPAGHHAEKYGMGGFCIFANTAIATEYLSKQGKRIAVLDIDVHHGNGTQRKFYDTNSVLTVSLHQDPAISALEKQVQAYPLKCGYENEIGEGPGRGFNKNMVFPKGADDNSYRIKLKEAVQLINSFKPDILVVAAGFDTYINDSLGLLSLTEPFYKEMGAIISAIKCPKLVIQEGGYSKAIGEIALNFLSGLS